MAYRPQVLPVAAGGTNAATMATSSGIVKYDGTSLVTSSTAQIDASNRYTNTSQPCFLAYIDGTVTNVTGAGATYTLGTSAFTEVYDNGGNFNTNGTFTAPVAGRYFLQGQVTFTGCTAATNFTLNLVTSNRTYQTAFVRAASANDFCLNINAMADMDASDTATLTVTVSGEAGNTVDILGYSAPNTYTFFSGYLGC